MTQSRSEFIMRNTKTSSLFADSLHLTIVLFRGKLDLIFSYGPNVYQSSDETAVTAVILLRLKELSWNLNDLLCNTMGYFECCYM
jgi:hypothetical protein